ncbi:MAG: glycosyltransferase family 2 protein [Myxococcota bacterium]
MTRECPTIGGFVIHGNSAGTLGRCLDSLLAVCDEVVAVDSESTDGSAEIVAARGVRAKIFPWRGFGAARIAALEMLAAADYVLYLDADERLADGAVDQLVAWKDEGPDLPQYTVTRRDWATIDGKRFLFRTETKVRLIRRDCATWDSSMIVHEALPRRPSKALAVAVEHEFASSLDGIVDKQREYAFLWAVRAHGEGRRSKTPHGRRVIHWLRNAVVKGALLRGGGRASRLAWVVSAYHADKYRYLAAVEAGMFPAAVDAWRDGRYDALFGMVRRGEHRLASPGQAIVGTS